MSWSRLLRVAMESIGRNKLRSLLTMLGIIIGVASVISLMALGEGSQKDVSSQVASMGTNLIMIRPGAARQGGVSTGAGGLSQSLSMADVDALSRRTTLLQGVTPEIRVSAQVVAGSQNWSTSIYGVSVDYPSIRNVAVETGSYFTERDNQTRARVAVLGKTVADELFPGIDPVGKDIRVGQAPFKVIGVLKEKGQSAAGPDQDDMILAPAYTVLNRLSDGKKVNIILASAKTADGIADAKEEITRVMRETHRLAQDADNDFSLGDQSELNKMATSITSILTLLMSSIAGVSLLVGGIGIMNIMLVSVTERTREIGLRMAIGARGGDVLAQFLVEALLLSLAGGILGVAAGVGLAYGLGAVLGMSVVLSPTVVVIAVLFTGMVGVFFGFYPARKAAQLNPIEALRYE